MMDGLLWYDHESWKERTMLHGEHDFLGLILTKGYSFGGISDTASFAHTFQKRIPHTAMGKRALYNIINDKLSRTLSTTKDRPCINSWLLVTGLMSTAMHEDSDNGQQGGWSRRRKPEICTYSKQQQRDLVQECRSHESCNISNYPYLGA